MEGDKRSEESTKRKQHFNPLPPHGGRLVFRCWRVSCLAFQSTPSAWRETDLQRADSCQSRGFQSTPSAWRETVSSNSLLAIGVISIHSLRMEGDPTNRKYKTLEQYFNPLPPHGGRLIAVIPQLETPDFNPLPPHGGRLSTGRRGKASPDNFNPLPPHGGRLWRMA